MKKLLALTLALTSGIALCACGETSSTADSASSAETSAAETEAETSAESSEESESESEAESDTIEIGTAEELVAFAQSVTDGSIGGAVTPGAVAGRAKHSVIESCEANVTLDGNALTDEIGKTDKMYESSDQGGEDAKAEEAEEEKPAA